MKGTEEVIPWDEIPDSEKVNSEEIEALDARSEGEWDGVNAKLRRMIGEAKTAEELKKIREDLKIPEPIERIDTVEFMKANRQILFDHVENNLLYAVRQSILVLGHKFTRTLFEKTFWETIELDKERCLK